MDNTTKQRVESIDAIKCLATISVICAHCGSTGLQHDNVSKIIVLILSNYGTWGVGCFFFVSGLLFSRPARISVFLRKKLRRLVIPWVISATIIYLYVALRKPPLSLFGWINFFIGNGSFYYYFTVLLSLFVIHIIPIERSKTIQVIMSFFSFISIVFYYDRIIPNPYLNIFNWVFYFGVGNIIGISKFEEIVAWARQKKIAVLLVLPAIILLIINVINREPGSYWGGLNAIATIMGSLCIITLANIAQYSASFLKIGKQSLFFYLWHMPIAGVLVNLTDRIGFFGFMALRPVIVMVIMYIVLLLLEKKAGKYAFLIGLVSK